MNLNDLAVKISKREGLKEQVNIAQIKEILNITLEELSKLPHEKIMEILSNSYTNNVMRNRLIIDEKH